MIKEKRNDLATKMNVICILIFLYLSSLTSSSFAFLGPSIFFVPPTPPNGTYINTTSVYIVSEITSLGNLQNINFAWDGNIYSIYNTSLVLSLPFNNASNPVDVSIYNNSVTNNGAEGEDGVFDKAFHFEQSEGDYVLVNNSSSLNLHDALSIGMWIKPSQNGRILLKGTPKIIFDLETQNISNLAWDPCFGRDCKRAQTFYSSFTNTLNSVELYLKKTGEWITNNVSVSIFLDDNDRPGTKIATRNISAQDIDTSYGWINVSFNISLEEGKKYWLVVESPSAGSCWDFSWGAGFRGDYRGYYEDGEAWYFDGSGWTTNDLWGVDMTFKLHNSYSDKLSMQDENLIKFLIYYGELQYINLENDSSIRLIIVADDNETEINKLRNSGIEVFLYKPLGSTYASTLDKNQWEQDIINFVDTHPYVDGFFWDELDPGYYGRDNVDDFNTRLSEINAHVHSKNQKTIANGVRYYATHCDNDYYLWESFMTSFTGDYQNPSYFYVDFFKRTSDDEDPLNWTNNIAKWEYLRDNGVLNKTLAHSYGDPNDDNKSIYAYIAAKILGVGGFSYADSNNFATTPVKLAKGMKWNLGDMMNTSIDENNGVLSGRFVNGFVEDDVKSSVQLQNAVYNTDLISNPTNVDILNKAQRFTGLSIDIVRGEIDFLNGLLRTSCTISPGWRHVFISFNKTKKTAKIYIDGQLCGETTNIPNISFNFSKNDIIIGKGYSGIIDELRIYNVDIPLNNVFGQKVTSISKEGNIFYLKANITSLTDGEHNYKILASDGIWNESENRYLFVDTNKPNVQFVNPTTQSGTQTHGYIEANVSASDPNLANITMYLSNSQGVLEKKSGSSEQLYVNFTNLTPGEYYLHAVATDLAGNKNSTETRKIYIKGKCAWVLKIRNRDTKPVFISNITLGTHTYIINKIIEFGDVRKIVIYDDWFCIMKRPSEFTIQIFWKYPGTSIGGVEKGKIWIE